MLHIVYVDDDFHVEIYYYVLLLFFFFFFFPTTTTHPLCRLVVDYLDSFSLFLFITSCLGFRLFIFDPFFCYLRYIIQYYNYVL